MPKFTYTVINKSGKSITGTGESASRDTLADTLIKQGLRPVSIKMTSEKKGFSAKLNGFSQ